LYIQWWSIIKNSAEDVSEERAIDAFVHVLRQSDFIKEMGRTKPITMSELMDVANRFADGEDTHNNKRAISPEDDIPHRSYIQRRMSRNYDNHNQIDAGFKGKSKKEEEHQNIGYCSKDEFGSSKQFRARNYDSSPEEILNGPCQMHYAYLYGNKVSNHIMRDCRTFLRL
jgi:hypothetical protein